MVDSLSPERRSWNMGRIRGRDTTPERIVRSALHRLGLRFRLHSGALPGRPDVVLPRWRTVVFVHGCFWHRHQGCRLAYTPKSRVEFWSGKFKDTVERDRRSTAKLEQCGWRVIVVWECETADREALSAALARLFQISTGD
ncbi:MAG TPA: DNA mismatch endonuclease Vsr [Thermoanaerobaculia bacterium]